MRIGVLGAMPEEVSSITTLLTRPTPRHLGGREFIGGRLASHDICVVHSRIGKVAAAAAAVELIARLGVEQIVFVGVAGGLAPQICTGDIVVADRLAQHDLDASPLFPPLEIPLTGRTHLPTDPAIRACLRAAAERFLAEEGSVLTPHQAPSRPPRVHTGEVATGDQFIGNAAARDRVRALLPGALCVEMEGAAVAQVCDEYAVPCGVARLISDDADDHAAQHFSRSLEQAAGLCAAGIIRRYIEWL
ncbi:MAG: 5'-methylthioadenosine/adenosylhomocysteine nucleosidase [Phycisphaerales bacterium]|nr:5'-methylthioadenosine/adenosylhomocysteine nucleosidase [Phycisphaerales bacterium]